MFESPALCDFEGPQWLIFSSNVAPLVYYSHLPIIIIALLLAVFVFLRGRKELPNRILFFTLTTFAAWVFLDSVFWASNRSDVIMFVWSVIIVIEPLVYAGSLYLIHALIDKRDMGYGKKLILALLFLPLIVFGPTSLSLSGFDTATCLAEEGLIAQYYTYFVEAIAIIWIIGFAVSRCAASRKAEERRQIILLTIGAALFLAAFSWGNITGSFTDNWQLGQYGLFGMPVFAAALVYLVVRYQMFNVKLIATQALTVGIWLLVFSLLFVQRIEVVTWVLLPTLALLALVGYLLVKSVKREVEQREQLQALTEELKTANDQLASANVKLKQLDQAKTEFLTITSHQLRTPLTGIKGYLSMMLEGDFGTFVQEQTDVLQRVSAEVDRLARMVQVFLNVSRIESGRLVIGRVQTNLADVVRTVIKELTPLAGKKKLQLSYAGPPALNAVVDPDKLKDVIMNLIDNSIKYTAEGSIHVKVEGTDRIAQVSVEDTGMGIDPGEAGKLFEKFSRGIGVARVSAEGTGLGLFIVKKIIEAHGGRVWAESRGKGKGSAFRFKVPLQPPEEEKGT